MLFKQATRYWAFFSFIFASLLAAPCLADNFEPIDHITTVTKNFILKNVAVDAGDSLEVKVDASKAGAELPVCKQDISAAFPANTNPEQITGIEITCNDTKSWHTLIPVDVQTYTPVLVAKRNIATKEEITDDLVEYASYSKNRLYNSFFKDKNEVVGQVAAYMITAGTAFTKKNLQAAIVIHRNDVVNLSATSKMISVAMQGIAKSDGGLNAVIKVYNPSSKRTVDAVVKGHNKAEVIS